MCDALYRVERSLIAHAIAVAVHCTNHAQPAPRTTSRGRARIGKHTRGSYLDHGNAKHCGAVLPRTRRRVGGQRRSARNNTHNHRKSVLIEPCQRRPSNSQGNEPGGIATTSREANAGEACTHRQRSAPSHSLRSGEYRKTWPTPWSPLSPVSNDDSRTLVSDAAAAMNAGCREGQQIQRASHCASSQAERKQRKYQRARQRWACR